MAEKLAYTVSLDATAYTGPMEGCVAAVKKLGAATQDLPTDTWDGLDKRFGSSKASLEAFKSSLGLVPAKLAEVGEAADKSAGKLGGVFNIVAAGGIAALAEGLGDATQKINAMADAAAETSPKSAAALGMVGDTLGVLKDAADGAKAGMMFGPVVAAGCAVVNVGLQAVIRTTETLEDANKNLTDSYAYTAQQRQEQIKRLAALEAAATEEYAQQQERKNQLTLKHMAHLEAVAKDQEENARKRTNARAEEEEKSASRVAAAREKAYGLKLSPQADLERQISEKKASGPTGQAAIDAAAVDAKEAIYTRTVALWEIEKKLSDLKAQDVATAATAVQQAQAQAQAAQDQAAAADKKAAAQARATAASAADFKGQNAILAARAAGDEKQARALERAAAVEKTRQQLMSEGAGPAAAAAQAENRQKLEEAVEHRAAHPNRIRTMGLEESNAYRARHRSPADMAQATTAQLRDRAASAAAAHHAAPAATAKDLSPDISKKLDTLDLILKKLENLAVA